MLRLSRKMIASAEQPSLCIAPATNLSLEGQQMLRLSRKMTANTPATKVVPQSSRNAAPATKNEHDRFSQNSKAQPN